MAGGRLFDDAAARRGWVDFRLGYQPAFDGLRGVGVTSILLFHCVIAYENASQSWLLPGAYLWLEMFFVQSGFLITSLLLDEWYRTGEIRLRNFYARRALRLLPAMLAAVLAIVVALGTFSPYGESPGAWQEVRGTLFYYQNWLAAYGTTKFPFYLSHTWSLSIEEQFYLVAPVAIFLLVSWQRSLRRVIPFLLAGAVASAVWMGVLASRVDDPLLLRRAYHGTDTRAQALLVGVALAFAVHAGLWPRDDRRHGRVARVWGLAGFAVLVAMTLTVNLRTTGWYYGGFLLCSASVAGVLSELVRHPRGGLARALSWKPLEVTGEMAYGLYLWHWPTIIVINQYTDWPELPTAAVQVVASFVVALLSYHLLEAPILDRWAPRFARTTPDRLAAHRRRLGGRDGAPAPGDLVPATPSGGTPATAPPPLTGPGS
ncbi:MAG TPA: acyltransferase [Acidimicrobiales bacterium]|nr:acyltransferase [Acidimicrobiales bacterium]